MRALLANTHTHTHTHTIAKNKLYYSGDPVTVTRDRDHTLGDRNTQTQAHTPRTHVTLE
jgi:hypothetical protein